MATESDISTEYAAYGENEANNEGQRGNPLIQRQRQAIAPNPVPIE
jgi:hypothetical protein